MICVYAVCDRLDNVYDMRLCSRWQLGKDSDMRVCRR